jgi:hypothetical protein
MEKNKQVLEFGDIIKEVDSGLILHYDLLRKLYLDFLDYIAIPWQDYIRTRTKNEVIGDFKHFNLYHYLPF